MASATILPGAVAEGIWELPTKLFVGGLATQTTTEGLHSHFSRYGRVVDAIVMQKNGYPRGFGFVTFDSRPAPGPAALVLAEPQWLDGRLIDVKYAVPGEKGQTALTTTLSSKEARKSTKLFVGGLSQDTATEDLKEYFGQYGKVADVVVMVDRNTNRSRGFGFVRFGGAEGTSAAEAVLADFAAHRIGGKWVEVKRATPGSQLGPEATNCTVSRCLSGGDAFLGEYCACGCWPMGCTCGHIQTPTASQIRDGSWTVPLDHRAKRVGRRRQEKMTRAEEARQIPQKLPPFRLPLGEVSPNHEGRAFKFECDDKDMPLFLPTFLHDASELETALTSDDGQDMEDADSENNPFRANRSAPPVLPPGLFGMDACNPMKITCRDGRLPMEDYFTREDFLSLEVRPVLSA